jgi:hypothetical protein
MAGAWNSGGSGVRVLHRRAHLLVWGMLAVLLPALLGGAIWTRVTAPPREASVLLAPP